MDVARHRGDFDAVRQPGRGGQVDERGLVAEALAQQQILLVGRVSVRRRRELVRVEVENLLAVEAIGLDVLVDDARGQLDARRRLPQDRGAAADAAARIDVLLRRRPDRVDEPRVARAIADNAQRRGWPKREVDRALQPAADRGFLHRVDVGLDQPFGLAEFGLVGDVADRPADAARSEQSALRPAQRLDAVEVEQVEVRREQRQRDDALVEVDADLLLHARLVADDLAGRDTAHRNLALPRPEILYGKPGDVAADVLECDRVGALYVGLGLGVDREGHVL